MVKYWKKQLTNRSSQRQKTPPLNSRLDGTRAHENDHHLLPSGAT